MVRALAGDSTMTRGLTIRRNIDPTAMAVVKHALDACALPADGRAGFAIAGRRPLAVAVADLDQFQRINDEFGLEAGDRVLVTFERTLAGSLPADAVIERLSGDEYAIGLPGATAESALIQLEEVRSHYAKDGVEGVNAVNASFGIAARPPHAEDTIDAVRCAGEALMRAKREGSGRSVI